MYGIAVFPVVSPTTDFEIWAYGNVDQIWWPGWKGVVFRWDGTTGKFLSADPFGWASGLNALRGTKQDRNGIVWGYHTFSLVDSSLLLFRYDPSDENKMVVEREIPDNFFAGGNPGVLGPDMTSDTLLGVNGVTPSNHLSVFRISTGALIRQIAVGGSPVDINWVDGGRAYVTCENGLFVLVDVPTGKVLSVFSQDQPGADTKTVYVPKLKRLLRADNTPDAVDGASTLVVKGYRPVPVAVQLTKPVLLDRPVAGRAVRAITRAIGQMGEPVSGLTVVASLSTANATLRNNAQITDSDGYAYFDINCISAGQPIITVQVEV